MKTNPKDIINAIQILLKDSYTSVSRKEEKTGSIGGDSKSLFAFEIHFVDYEKQPHNQNRGTKMLDNQDYWLPQLREILPIVESNWINSDYCVIWVEKL